MNKVIILLIIFTVLLLYLRNVNINQENFYGSQCPNEENLTCLYDPIKQKYTCNYNAGTLTLQAPDECCPINCKKFKKNKIGEEMVEGPVPKGDEQFYYYCNLKNKCVGYKRNLQNRGINNCGFESKTNLNAPIYDTYEKCQKSIDPCKSLPRDKCLNTEWCGVCTDSNGKAECLQGTPNGPIDLYKNCLPFRKSNNNKWTYGQPSPFVRPKITKNNMFWNNAW